MEIRNQSKTGPVVPPPAELTATLSHQIDDMRLRLLDRLNQRPRQFRSDRSRDPRPLPSPRRPDDRQPPGRGRRPRLIGPGPRKRGARRRPITTPSADATAETPPPGRPGRLDRHPLLRPQGTHRQGPGSGGDRDLSRVGRPGDPQGLDSRPAKPGRPPAPPCSPRSSWPETNSAARGRRSTRRPSTA